MNINMKKILAAVLAVLTLAFCLVSCGSTSEPTATEATTGAPGTATSEWDRATKKWIANTALSFELRVKSDENLAFESVDNDQGLVFGMSDGKTVTILIQGLDYENTFDAMVRYFSQKPHEKVSVGRDTKTIIAVYDSENVEIVSKLSDNECLTTTAPDVETAKALFSLVMIKVEGVDFTPLDMSDTFDEVG